MDKKTIEQADCFPRLSRRVMELVSRVRELLCTADNTGRADALSAECDALSAAIRKAENSCNADMLVGICSAGERAMFIRRAQQCGRLDRIVYQSRQIIGNVRAVAGKVTADDMTAFRSLYLMAEVQLRDAVLAVLRDDVQMAYNVRKQDEELDALYAGELERIFRDTASAVFYDFETGARLLFILRAIERIGDHAKQLAVSAFYPPTDADNAAAEKKSANPDSLC